MGKSERDAQICEFGGAIGAYSEPIRATDPASDDMILNWVNFEEIQLAKLK